ncbi:PQQ-binding-like beta-propeller repeat protein [Streptomyces sp. NPDC058864]
MPPVRRPGTDPEAEHPEYAGQYRLEGRLGSGGMGVVHLSRSTSGMRLAVKVVHEEFARDPEFRARFRQEVAAARRVSGAFTASVVDADPDAERPWMATLHIPGPTLAEFVKRNGPVAPAQVRYLMEGLAEALRDIHRAGVVHRDLKPSNVLLAVDGPKVIDFGISRPSDSELRTETGKLIGTPPFMAPEQFRRPRDVGPAADVFAMASVLVHAATGRSPFDSDSPYIVAYQVVHDEPQLDGIPADLRPLIERCLAKNPEDRPSPDALMAELRTVSASYDTQTFNAFEIEGLVPAQRQSSEGQAVPSAGKSAPATATEANPRSRRRALRAIVAAATLAMLGLGAVWATTPDSARTGPPEGSGGRSAVAAFRPWETVLRSSGATTPAACGVGAGALFCNGPGVKAAKVDPDSGLLQWSVHAQLSRIPGTNPPAPELAGGVLRVVSEDESRMEGLDPDTGRSLWTLDISAYEGSPTGVGTTVLFSGRDGTVTAVDGTTGKERWRRKLPGFTRPSIGGNGTSRSAYAVESAPDGRHTRVAALRLADGRVERQVMLGGQLSFLGESGGTLFLASSDALTRVNAIVRLRTTDWSSRRIPLTIPLVEAHAAVRGGTVYLLEYEGSLLAVDTDRASGAGKAEQWRLETSVSGGSWPTVAGRGLYFSAADGRLLAVDAERGVFLGQTKPRLGTRPAGYPGFPPSPVVADGKVFATAPDGTVFAVDAKDPSRW